MDSTTKGLRTTGAELSPLRSELALKPRLTRRVARARVRGGAGGFLRKPVGAAPWEALQILAMLALPIQLAMLSQGSRIRGLFSSHGKDKGI